jgi:hypothetical protein
VRSRNNSRLDDIAENSLEEESDIYIQKIKDAKVVGLRSSVILSSVA